MVGTHIRGVSAHHGSSSKRVYFFGNFRIVYFHEDMCVVFVVVGTMHTEDMEVVSTINVGAFAVQYFWIYFCCGFVAVAMD